MKSIYVLGVLLSLALQAPAQTSGDNPVSFQDGGEDSYAPLLIFTNGSGRVYPFRDGQMLQVGRRYIMMAIPDRGYVFANWNPVNVFTFTERVYDQFGNLETITNSVVSGIPQFTRAPVLRFTMQPEVVILDDPGIRTITVSRGWQANFVAARRWGYGRDR